MHIKENIDKLQIIKENKILIEIPVSKNACFKKLVVLAFSPFLQCFKVIHKRNNSQDFLQK